MRNKLFWRWDELGAVFSLIIWLILTPFMATIWVYDGGRLIWNQQPLLVRTVGRWLAEQGAFAFAAEEVVYHSYGRYFFLVYLLLIPTLMAVHHRYASENKRHRRWYKILSYALLLAAISDYVSYGLGIFSSFLWQMGFGLEMLALLVVIVASVFYGWGWQQQANTPRWLGWLLIVSAILVPPMFFERALTGYWPNSPVLPLVLAWAGIGVCLRSKAEFPMRWAHRKE